MMSGLSMDDHDPATGPRKSGYRFSGDTEPSEKELAALMHEVAVEAKTKSERAQIKLHEKIRIETCEALAREGYSRK